MLTLYPFLSILSISCIYIFLLLDTPSFFNFSGKLSCSPTRLNGMPATETSTYSNQLSPTSMFSTWHRESFMKHDATMSWKTWPKLSLKKLPNDSDVWSDWICEPSTWPPPQVLPKYQIVSRILEFNPRPEAVWCQQSSTSFNRENYGSVRKCKAGWSLHSKTAV